MKKITPILACVAAIFAAYVYQKESGFARRNLVYYEEKWKDGNETKTALVFMDHGKISNSSISMSYVDKFKFYRHINRLWKKSTRCTTEQSMPCYAVAKFSNGEIYSYPIDSMFFGHYKASLED